MNLATPQKRPHFNGEVVTPNTEDRQDYMIDKLKTNRFTLTTEKWHDEDDLDTQMDTKVERVQLAEDMDTFYKKHQNEIKHNKNKQPVIIQSKTQCLQTQLGSEYVVQNFRTNDGGLINAFNGSKRLPKSHNIETTNFTTYDSNKENKGRSANVNVQNSNVSKTQKQWRL